MKKVKDYIFIISICYMVIIIFLIINLFIAKRPYINLTTPDNVKNDYVTLKTGIENIKDPVCKTAISDLLAKYIINSYDGKVSVNKLYDYIITTNVTEDYDVIKTKCNLKKDMLNKYNIENRYATMLALREEIVSNYFYQYELRFTDELSYQYYDNLSQVAYNSLKYNETELINDYLNMVGEE